jgi:hypothetical protein
VTELENAMALPMSALTSFFFLKVDVTELEKAISLPMSALTPKGSSVYLILFFIFHVLIFI